MTASAGFIEMLRDALQGAGPVVFKRMFGGAGAYADGAMFALVADDVLYLKADETTRAAFEVEGMGPFVYDGKGKPIAMSYWRVPERLYDDPDEMAEWARRAIGVARRAAVAKARSAQARAEKSRPPGRSKRSSR